MADNREIEETRKKYEFIVNTSREFMTFINRDYVYEAVNESYCNALKRSRQEIVGKTMAEIWGEEKFRSTIKEHIDLCFSGKEVSMQSHFTFGALDERYIDIHYYPFYNKEGLVTHSAVVSTDITERKLAEIALQKANEELELRVAERTTELVSAIEQLQKQIAERKLVEESLRESEEKFRALAEYSNDIIMRFDRELKHLYVNKAIEKNMGIPVTAFLGKTHEELGFPENLIRLWNRALLSVFETKEPARLEFEYNQAWVDWSVTPEFDSEGNVKTVLTSARDITDRKKNEQELIRAREQALEASRLKSEFLANMSHEIRTPLNGIIGMTNLLLSTPLNPEQKEFTKIIRSSGDVLLGILNDILDFSKIEAGKLELEKIEFHIRSIVEEAVALFTQKAREKNIELASLVYQDVPEIVNGDPGRLRQVLINLIGNAVKFTDQGEVVVRVKLQERSNNKMVLYFSVTDTGIGLTPEGKSRLFNPFTQADGSTTRKYGGTGLGLSISKRIAEMMHGEIGVESEINKGSTFHFTAEFCEPQFEVHEKYSSAFIKDIVLDDLISDMDRTKIEVLRVLVAEDNTTNQKVALHMLKNLGLKHIDIVANGKEVLDAVNKVRYDIVFMDCQMPELDGFETTRAIREKEENKEHLAIIAMTANALQGDREKCFSAGMDDYIPKPINPSLLGTVLKRYLTGELSSEPIAANIEENAAFINENHIDILRKLGGKDDPKLINQFIETYIEDAPLVLKQIEQCIKVNNSKELKLAAHKLKGASGNIGAEYMQKLSAELETAAEQNNFKPARSIFNNLLKVFEQTKTGLIRFLVL